MAKRPMGKTAPDGNGDAGNTGGNIEIVGADSGTGDLGSLGADFIIIDPDSVGNGGGSDSSSGGSDTSEPVRKRRGRKPGTGTRAKKSTLDLNGVEAILFSAHQMLSVMVQTPELALDKTEAAELAKAIDGVSRHYDVQASEKALDWTRLVMALGMVYGPRMYAIRARVKNAPAQPKAPVENPASGGNVIDIPGVGKVNAGGFNA